MKRVEFVIWAGKQGWKHGQKYLNKAYNYFFDKGKIPNSTTILQKAKDYYKNFPKIVTKTKITPKVVAPKPGFNPSVIKGGKKADGGRIDKVLPTRSRDI
jgi:hypothetical protein